jgi:Zinc finger, C3HC4 type (RING finger)
MFWGFYNVALKSNMSSRRIYRFHKPSKISEDFICTICSEVFYDPVKLPCSHMLCQECVAGWGKIQNSCPICRTTFKPSEFQSPTEVIGKIEEIRVVCKYSHCYWTGPLKELEKHEESCNFSPEKTDNKILELLPKYEKSGDTDLDTPDINLISILYSTHKDIISKVLLAKDEDLNWHKKSSEKLKKDKKIQMSIKSFLKTVN